MRRVVVRATILYACSLVLAAPTQADPPVYEITPERIERLTYVTGGQSISEPFLYRAGDDPAWATPEYDDSGWELAHTRTPSDRGIGWYRMRLVKSPALAGERLGLAVVGHGGPFEVYLDGRLILQSGNVAATRAEERSGAGLIPVPLFGLEVGREHLLAVRFSNHAAASPIAMPDAGLSVVLGRYGALVQNRSMHVWQATLFLVLTLLLAFQHLLLFLFYRKRRESLYFAGYTSLVALFFAAYLMYYISADALISGLAIRVWLAAMAATGIAALLFLYEIFQVPRPLVFRVAVPVSAVIVGWSLLDPATAMAPARLLLMALVIESLRVVYVAFRKRRRGALLLSAAIVPMSIFMVVEQAAYLGLWHAPWLPYFSAIFLSFLILVVVMAVYLARDFAEAHNAVQAAHDELEEANRTLDDQVAQRTAELQASLEHLQATQERLVQQEKMASLGALTAGIAHEIKNPLNFVNNFAQLAAELVRELRGSMRRELREDEEIAQLLDDLEQNASKVVEHGRRADNIVRAMLMHSRGGSHQREPVDMNALVKEYAGLAFHGMRAQRSNFNCDLQWSLAEGLPPIEGVPQDLGRVILNIVNNAFYAVGAMTNGATPTVRIETARRGDDIEVRISDSGPGMSEEVRRRIFEPFFTTKPTGEGTGLGLSMSHDIVVHGHGGSLEVESEEGQGTTFVIRLPISGVSTEPV